MKLVIEYPAETKEITLGQWQDYLKLFEKDKDYEPTVKDIFKIFTNINPSLLPKSKVDEIVEKIVKAIEGVGNCKGLYPIIEIEGKQFGFIPNLDKMSFGENEDIVQSLQSTDTFHNALEVLYRPIKKRFKDFYTIEYYKGYGERERAFKEVSVEVFQGALVFFYRLINDLELDIKSSFRKEKKTTKRIKYNSEEMLRKYFLRNGVFIKSL